MIKNNQEQQKSSLNTFKKMRSYYLNNRNVIMEQAT